MHGSTHNASNARIRIDTGIVLWASFLAASIATMMFFGLFDPVLLADDVAPPAVHRVAGAGVVGRELDVDGAVRVGRDG